MIISLYKSPATVTCLAVFLKTGFKAKVSHPGMNKACKSSRKRLKVRVLFSAWIIIRTKDRVKTHGSSKWWRSDPQQEGNDVSPLITVSTSLVTRGKENEVDGEYVKSLLVIARQCLIKAAATGWSIFHGWNLSVRVPDCSFRRKGGTTLELHWRPKPETTEMDADASVVPRVSADKPSSPARHLLWLFLVFHLFWKHILETFFPWNISQTMLWQPIFTSFSSVKGSELLCVSLAWWASCWPCDGHKWFGRNNTRIVFIVIQRLDS